MQFSMILNYETSHWIVRSFRYYHINFIPKVENTFILSLAHSTNRDNLKLKIGRSLMFLDVVHVTSAHAFQFFAQISETKIKTSQNNTENKNTTLVIQIELSLVSKILVNILSFLYMFCDTLYNLYNSIKSRTY